MEPATSAIGLVDASLKLIDTVHKFCSKLKKVPARITSIQGDLHHINEAIKKGSGTANGDGSLSWLNDLRCIKLRIEDAVELYNMEFTGHTRKGILAPLANTVKRKFGPEGTLLGYLKEIEDLITEAKNRVQAYYRESQRQAGGDNMKKKEDFHHEIVADPVGLEIPMKELFQMLSDGTLLRVVAVSSPDTRGSQLAKSAYDKVKEEFACKAWVTVPASHDNCEHLLKDILDRLDDQTQQAESLSLDDQTQQAESLSQQLTRTLKDFLNNKRYIIGIDGLETTSYWNAVLNAFPEDNTSSRIIVTTRQEEIAQTCHKNCPVYPAKKKEQNSPGFRMRKLYSQSFDEAFEAELVQILCTGTTRKRRVVAISGPGGSGKSVLAKAAYNQVKDEEVFGLTARVTPSPHHNEPRKKLLLDIIDEIVGNKGRYDGKSSSQLIEELERLLLNNRYIIVIDGLETLEDLINVLSACPDDNIGSRIIVTTTSNEVVNTCERNGPIYMMQPLDANSAKDLLVKKVFRENKFPENSDTNLMMMMIIQTCEYLPLAIANMGDYMRSSDVNLEYTECENACINIGSLFDKKEAFRGMKHVLDRSYTSLNDNAKACLLSLSIYSKDLFIKDCVIEDHVIKGKPLIRRLLAERLISPEEGIANQCFTTLIDRNFIVPVKFSISGQVKTFRVNRMIPQFINGKGDNGNYVTRIDTQQDKGTNQHTEITRLYLHNTSIDCPKIGEKIGKSHVRLLTFHGKASEALMDFNDYTFLRVLILENCGNMENKHLDTICSQRILRYLSIRDNEDVTMLPKNIVNMRSLETLDTRGTSVDKISMDVILLQELLHLFGEFQITGTENFFPKENSKRKMLRSMVVPQKNSIPVIENSKLQTLAGFVIDENSDFVKLLPRMPMLRKVRIVCRKTPSEKVIQDLECLERCFEKVNGRNSPHSLSIDFRDGDLNFLDALRIESPCPLLSLKLRGKLTKLPKFLLSFSDSLNELCLLETSLGAAILSELQQLKNLQFLKITQHQFEFKEKLNFQSSWFGRLQRLCFDVETVPEIVIQKNAMKGLNSLQLLCKELGGVSGILNLKQLQEVILPNEVSGEEVEKLVEQVRKHDMKPKILNVDRTSRPLFTRSRGFSKGAFSSSG